MIEQNELNIDILSEDVEEMFQEQDEAVYRQEVVAMKRFKHLFEAQKGQFKNLLEQNYSSYASLIKSVGPWLPLEQGSEIIYRVLKIREIYQKTHYAFLHGRSLEWNVFSYFTKKLIQVFKPHLHTQFIEFLRIPVKIKFQNVSTFLEHTRHISDVSSNIRNLLICADAYWLSCAWGESAMSLFSGNLSMANSTDSKAVAHACRPLIASCLGQEILHRQSLVSSYLEKIHLIAQIEKQRRIVPGALVVICIPKNLVKNSSTNPVYRSYPGGQPCQCNGKTTPEIPFLEKLQQDCPKSELETEEIYLGHNNFYYDNMLQYRLLAHQLVPKNGVKIFRIDGLTKEERTYKKPIQEIVQEIFTLVTQNKEKLPTPL